MCTNFLLTAPASVGSPSPQIYVSARCLELATFLAVNIYQVPRQQQFPLVSHGLQNPASWINQYGFVGIANSGNFDALPIFMDGLNEAGLSCAFLWMPGAEYPEKGDHPQVAFCDLVMWVLGNFDTVEALVSSLTGDASPGPISVLGPAPGEKGYLPGHFIATDATGASTVIEFVNGEMVVYPPSYKKGATANGVLTNAPTYDWQVANLNNYDNLTVIGQGTTTNPDLPPVGSGLLGLPGDPMPASRFVRASALCKGWRGLSADGTNWLNAPYFAPPGGEDTGFAGPVQTVVNVAMQMVWAIQFTPYGTAQVTSADPNAPAVGDWTQWAVVRDHSNRVYYFNSAFNSLMQAIDLTQLNFESGPSFPQFPYIDLLPPVNPTTNWFQSASFSAGG